MTLWEVERLFSYWRRSPPAGDLLRAIAQTLGVEMPVERRGGMSADDFVRWVDATGGRIE